MFERNTVFIIGAGASTHFGYPTNNGLLNLVQQQAEKFISFNKLRFSNHPNPIILDLLIDDMNQITDKNFYWQNFETKCEELVSKINFQKPIMIDDFLRDHPNLRLLGKTLIAYIIGKIEQKQFANNNFSFNENWISLIANIMANECKEAKDILNNNVHFITFNYDLSLERNLIKNISSRTKFSNIDLRKFISDRVIHIYGSISNDPFSEPLKYWLTEDPITRHQQQEFCEDLNTAYLSSNNLRLISSEEKDQNITIIDNAKRIISNAQDIYILGYSFDSSNNLRLGFPETVTLNEGSQHPCQIYVTTHGDNRVAVSRRIGASIYGDQNVLLQEKSFSWFNYRRIYITRSEERVFEALANEFL